MSDVTTNIWKRVKDAYAHTGRETQEEIAEALSIRQSAVSKWKRGMAIPTVANLVKIADQTGVRLEWLITGRGARSGGESDPLLTLLDSLDDDTRAEILAFARFRSTGSNEQ